MRLSSHNVLAGKHFADVVVVVIVVVGVVVDVVGVVVDVVFVLVVVVLTVLDGVHADKLHIYHVIFY